MKAVSKEIAKREVLEWLDFKRVRESKREALKNDIETLTLAFEDGLMSLNEDTKEINFQLSFKIGDSVDVLKFKPRLTVGELHNHLANVKSGDIDGRIIAYISALTEMNSGLIRSMDTEDLSLASAIAYFFL